MGMHPVLQHLLERRGQAVPRNDGRKIILVLFGGIMVAVRGAAALTAFEELGLTGSFDEIYTMSSGFANASYFLSGQMRNGTAAYYRDLSGLKFINIFRPWRLANLDLLLETARARRPVDVQRLFASPTRLYTMVTKMPDLNKGIFLELHDFKPEEYFDLLRACSSLPVVAKGHVQLKGEDYRDVFYDEALKDFMEKVISVNATDVLIVYNYDWQRSYVHSVVNMDRENVYEFTPAFFSGKPEWLQKLTRLETRSGTLRKQAERFGNEVKRVLGSNEPLQLL